MLASLPRQARGRAADRRRRLADENFASAMRHHVDGRILVLSPHPDDAVFSAWSVLSAAPAPVVVNVFAAEPLPGSITYWDRICGATDSAEQMRARVAEDRAVLEPLVGTPLSLGLLDQQYRRTTPSLSEIERRLRAVIPCAARVYAPASVGSGHPDHRLVRTLARAMARAGVPVVLYADLPYAARYGWPAWVNGTPPDPHLDVDPYWEALAADVPETGGLRAAEVVALDEAEAARKLHCMRLYATQFRALDWGGLLSDPGTHGYEVFWPLAGPNPPHLGPR
jgi:LmbE family N-acetylglucosaminyl deacetylase